MFGNWAMRLAARLLKNDPVGDVLAVLAAADIPDDQASDQVERGLPCTHPKDSRIEASRMGALTAWVCGVRGCGYEGGS